MSHADRFEMMWGHFSIPDWAASKEWRKLSTGKHSMQALFRGLLSYTAIAGRWVSRQVSVAQAVLVACLR